MARRSSKDVKRNKSFTDNEASHFRNAVTRLYRRSLFHLVAPRFNLPNMRDVYHSLIHPDVWHALEKAHSLCVPVQNHFMQTVTISDTTEIGAHSSRLFPDLTHVPLHGDIPRVLVEYADAAHDYARKWKEVLDAFTALNELNKRSAVLHYWPCVQAVIRLWDKTAMFEVGVRPGELPGEMTVVVRDTGSFVMEHMLLPPVPQREGANHWYDGDSATDLAAQLCFRDQVGTLPDELWPITGE